MSNKRKAPIREEELERQLEQIGQQLKKHSAHLPPNRKPTILVCGKMGNGKTTTINTLFGRQVGEVGFFTRGTKREAVYEWESESENINIVDLPGLGDAPKYDKVFREIYERRVKEADGFIVIVAPPRPAEEGTLKTVRLLLRCKVPSGHIIFGFNKLSQLYYPDGDSAAQVELSGVLGPTAPRHARAVEEAKRVFYEDLCNAFPKVKFGEDQIIPFDAHTGWNLHKMLIAVIDTLPFQTLVRLHRAAAEAQREARRREAARLKAQRERLIAEEGRLRKEREEARKKQRQEAARARREETERKKKQEEDEASREREERAWRDKQLAVARRERELKEAQEKHQRELEALQKFDARTAQLERTVMDKFFTGIEKTVAFVDPNLGEAVRNFREVAQEVLPKVADKVFDLTEKAVDKVTEKVGGWLKKASSWW